MRERRKDSRSPTNPIGRSGIWKLPSLIVKLCQREVDELKILAGTLCMREGGREEERESLQTLGVGGGLQKFTLQHFRPLSSQQVGKWACHRSRVEGLFICTCCMHLLKRRFTL